MIGRRFLADTLEWVSDQGRRLLFDVSSLWRKGIRQGRLRPPARQEGIVSSSNSSKEWIQEEVLLLSVTKDCLHDHPFHCLHGCHKERLAIDEALYSVAVFQWFLCVCEGIFRLVSGKCGKTTGVALGKALECLACHPRAHQAVSARHTFKGDLGLLWDRCSMRLYTSKNGDLMQEICIFQTGYVFSELRSKETLSAALSQESTIALELMARGNSLMHAWITHEAFESVSQRDSWLFAAIPEHKYQNTYLFLSRFLTERQESSLSSPLCIEDTRHHCG